MCFERLEGAFLLRLLVVGGILRVVLVCDGFKDFWNVWGLIYKRNCAFERFWAFVAVNFGWECLIFGLLKELCV